jgi:hypothetical protein
MASLREHDDNDEPGRDYDDELLADVSADKRMADAPQDEDEEHRRIRRIKNAKRAKSRRNAEARARNPPHRRNLNNAFTTARNIAEAALLIQWLPQNPDTERLLQLTQPAIIQLDQRDLMSSLQRTRSRSGRHKSSILKVSHTSGGGP